MLKKWIFLTGITLLLLALLFPAPVAASNSKKVSPAGSDPYTLIAEVNALRAASGLPAYTINPILMGIAQQHADFMSVNGVSHYGYGGTRPFQRALAAGYQLAGDLSLGGFFSENITAGSNKTATDAVIEWQGDAPHLNTMLSPNLQEIGAGVTVVGDYVYYVIDCARPSNSTISYTPSASSAGGDSPADFSGVLGGYAPPLVNALKVTSTSLPDGKLFHQVQGGETLWLIAVTYGVKVADIRSLNGLAETDAIYPGETLLISLTGPTSAPTLAPETETPAPAASWTPRPTSTPYPTWTPSPSVTPPLAFSGAERTGLSTNRLVGIAIILAALVLAGVFVFSMRKS